MIERVNSAEPVHCIPDIAISDQEQVQARIRGTNLESTGKYRTRPTTGQAIKMTRAGGGRYQAEMTGTRHTRLGERDWTR